MRLLSIIAAMTLAACGSGNFGGKTETENRPRKLVEAKNLQASDDSGTSDGEAKDPASDGASTKDGTDTAKAPMPGFCPQLDQATIDALIASGKEFEVECEFEIEVEGAEGDD